MEVIATGKYISVSPKKARAIVDLVRGKNAKESVALLKQMPQVGAEVVSKVINSAMANAENNFNLDKSMLTIAKITVNGGPTIKRFQPRAKGMASSIRRRTSHIEVVVSGDIKTKAKKESKHEEAKTMTEESAHKIEMNRPEEKAAYVAPKPASSKVFRRKTGA
jgi:large subunit ribosomal protein L22